MLAEQEITQTEFMQTYLHKSFKETQNEIYQQAAIRFYKKNILSLGKAAEFANLSKMEFIDLLKFNQEVIFDYDNDVLSEIASDSNNLNKMLR